MGPTPLSSARLGTGSTLSAGRSIADSTSLRIRVDVRRCKRRLFARAKVTSKATDRTFKLGGSNKKPANQKASGTGSRTVQLRRRGTVKMDLPGSMTPRRPGPRDPKTVFVAGASGRLGSRIVRQLLQDGLKVVAGARNVENAKESIAAAAQFGALTRDQARRLKIVPFSLDKDVIAAAIGNAGKVVSAMGARGADFANPCAIRNIDGEGNIKIVNVAAELGVQQFVLVSSLATGKFGWPASSTNLIWGILSEKRRSEQALEASGMAYTIVRPGGIERPTDSHKETHNVRVSTRDTLFGGSVSRLQLAELIAACCANPQLSQNKTLEVVAETDAPQLKYTDILAKHPAEVAREEQLQKQQTAAQILKDIAAAEKRIDQLKNTSEDLGERAAALQARVKEFQSAERGVTVDAAGAMRGAAKLQKDLDALRSKAEGLARQEAAARTILAAIQKAGRSGKLLTKQEQDAVALPILQPELARAKAEEERKAQVEAAQVRKAAQQKPQAVSVEKAKTALPKTAPKKTIPKKAAVRPAAVAVRTSPKTTEVVGDAAIEQSVLERAEADREAQRQAEERRRAERVVKLEKEQRAKEKAADKATKAAEAKAREEAKSAATAKKAAQAAEAAKKKEAQLKAETEAKEKKKLAREADEAKKAAELKAKQQALEKKEAEAKAKAQDLAKKKEEAKTAKAAKAAATAKTAAAAKARQATAPTGGGFKWPWESSPSSPPVPQEILDRRAEAQDWIDTWRAKGASGAPGDAMNKEETKGQAKAVEAAKEKPGVEKAQTAVKPEKKAAPAAKAKPVAAPKAQQAAAPTGGVFRWPWAPPPVPQEILERQQEAQDWIDAWRARSEQGSSSDSVDSGDNVADAREWIRSWRAKNLEKQLPK